MNFFEEALKPLLKLAFPMILMGIVLSAVLFFDTIFLSRLGEKILAIGSLVNWLFWTLNALLIGTLNSINVLVSHKFGEKDHRAISGILRDGFVFGFLIAIIVFVLFRVIAPVLGWFGQNAESVYLAEIYLHALSWGMIPLCFTIILLEFITGIAHLRIATFTNISVVVLNIFFNYVLIFGKLGFPKLGLAGAGWGVTISYAIIFCFLLFYLMTQKNYRIYFEKIFDFNKPFFIRSLLKIGVPIGLMYGLEIAFFLVLTFFMASLDKKSLVPNQITLQYMCTLMAIVFSIANAVTVRIGHVWGAKEYHMARSATQAGLLITFALTILSAIAYIFFPSWLISMDFDIHDPRNAELVHYTKQFFLVCALYQLFESIRITLFGSLRGLMDTRFTLLASLIGYWVIPIPIGYGLMLIFNLSGIAIWWGMTLGALVSMLLLYYRFKLKTRAY